MVIFRMEKIKDYAIMIFGAIRIHGIFMAIISNNMGMQEGVDIF